MSIRLGSKLRVTFRFLDEAEDGTSTPINLAAVTEKSVRVIRPDGTDLPSPPTLTPTATEGEAEMEFAPDVLNRAGRWQAEGIADGYRSDPVSWRVERGV